MTKVTGPLMSSSATGPYAAAIAFARTPRATLARRLPTAAPDYAPPAPSAPQLAQRARYAAAVASWRAATPADRDANQQLAATMHISLYSAWIAVHAIQPPPAAGTVWDDGATTWDAGATTWD